MFTFFKQHRIWSFHVVVLQRTVKKCTKNCNTRAHPLFCSLNILFSDVPVAVAVVVLKLPNITAKALMHSIIIGVQSAQCSAKILALHEPLAYYGGWGYFKRIQAI